VKTLKLNSSRQRRASAALPSIARSKLWWNAAQHRRWKKRIGDHHVGLCTINDNEPS
jgi:hypothetical protein